MIKSRCYSDDHLVEVEFDATPWFETASDEKIVTLMNCRFGGDYGADTVAEDMIDRNSEIKKMFDYIRIIQDSPAKKDACGFECHVDTDQALNWISKYRPHIDISEVMIEHDLFKCGSCSAICDIEDSVREDDESELVCENCC